MATKTTATGIKKIAGIKNSEFWDKARAFSPTFKSHTAEATAVEFTEKGFEQIKLQDTNILNEFFEISMRISFQLLNVAQMKNPLIDKGLVQVFDTPNGGYVQRMAIQTIKPVNPAFTNLEDGGTVDPFVIRKPEATERFFEMNFDYQNLITLQEYQLKTMWISEYGVGEFIAGVLKGLENGYVAQEYLNTMACINGALNSEQNPLKDTQVINLSSWTDENVTDAELIGLILAIKNMATKFNVTPTTSAYNAMGFDTALDVSDHILLIREGIKNEIDVKTMVGAFNPDMLSVPFDTVEVENFGGLVPMDSTGTEMNVAYDKLGTAVGFVPNTVSGEAVKQKDGTYMIGDTVVSTKPDHYDDPNSDVLAVLMQKGAIFENAQNPYSVTPIYNPRGLYTNYIASRPRNGINYDALYTVVAFRKPQ